MLNIFFSTGRNRSYEQPSRFNKFYSLKKVESGLTSQKHRDFQWKSTYQQLVVLPKKNFIDPPSPSVSLYTVFLSLFPYLLTHPQQISLQCKSIFSLLDKPIRHAFLLTTKQTGKMILWIPVPTSCCARKLNMETDQLEKHF